MSAEQQVGDLAARALDRINGRELIGAVLILAVEDGQDDDITHSSWFTPDRQPWALSLGMIEDWRMTQAAMITASAIEPDAEVEDDEANE